MASLSGTIRQGLGIRKSTANTRCSKAEQTLKTPTPDDIDGCRFLLRNVHAAALKPADSVQSFKEADQQWSQLIIELQDSDQVRAEEEIYAKHATDPSTGYLVLMNTCSDLKCDLDSLAIAVESQIQMLAPSKTPSNKSTTANNQPTQIIRARLPKLELPGFDGKDALEWNQFWTIFSANVDTQNITIVEQFAYLLSKLRGTAKDTLKGLSINEHNYAVSVTLLKQRFERPNSTLVALLYRKLKQIPCSNNGVSVLRQTFNATESFLRQLENLGENIDANTALALDILSKYPTSVVKELYRHYKVTDSSTISDIRQAILNYISDTEGLSEKMSYLQLLTPSDKATNKTFKEESVFKYVERPESTVLSTVEQKQNNQQRPRMLEKPPGACYFCGGDHSNSDCPKYRTAADRLMQLRKSNRCLKCAGSNHMAKDCRKRVHCVYCKTSDHYTALCRRKFPSIASKQSDISTVKSPRNDSDSTTRQAQASNSSVTVLNVGERATLLTATTTIINPISGRKCKARLLFDSASQCSYITEGLVDQLCLSLQSEETIHVSVFSSKKAVKMSSNMVSFNVLQANGSVKSITAHTTPLITDCSVLPDKMLSQDISILQKMDYLLADNLNDKDGSVQILIGSEYFWDFITGQRLTTESNLLLISSTLGLLLAGSYQSASTEEEPATLLCFDRLQQVHRPCLHKPTDMTNITDVDNYWSLERLGITDDPIESDDDKALEIFNATVKMENQRYQVQWPWIEDKRNMLPSKYELSLGRLKSLLKKLKTQSNSEVASKYQETIQCQLDNGIIERVATNEISSPKYPAHYLPHHPVVKLSSNTTKLRIVYDASAKVRKDALSLNECIYRGPVLLPHLCEMLIRFRTHEIIVLADIEKAFLQLELQENERDATRFLWIRDPKHLDVTDNLDVLRFRRVPFGVIASPFLLSATIRHHLQQYITSSTSTLSASAKTLIDNTYVDNIMGGSTSAEEATHLLRNMTTIFSEASMNLQEFCSNDDTVLRIIPENKQVKNRDMKMLGIMWDSVKDNVQLRSQSFETTVVTKRTILRS